MKNTLNLIVFTILVCVTSVSYAQDETGTNEWFSVEQGDWTFYPGFRADRTISGIVAIATPDSVSDNNYSMVYFEHQGDDTWSSWGWKQAPVVDAVLFARERDADAFETDSPWKDDPRLTQTDYLSALPTELVKGFEIGDPIRVALDSLNADALTVETLADANYQVAPSLSASQYGDSILTSSADDDCLRATLGSDDDPTLDQFLSYVLYVSHEWSRTTGRGTPPSYDPNGAAWDVGKAILACWPCRGCTSTPTSTWTVTVTRPVILFVTWCQYSYTITYTTVRTGQTLFCNPCTNTTRTCTETVVLPVLSNGSCLPAIGPLFGC